MGGSLMDKLESQALDQFQKHGADWLGKVIDGAKDEIHTIPTDSMEGTAVRATASMAIAKLEANKDRVAALGYQRTVAFLGKIAMGHTEQAARILSAYGGGRGAWGAADAMVIDAAERVAQAKRDQDSAIAFAKEIGSVAAKALLPILMSAVI